MKKYELTNETMVVDGRTLHRIRALRSFGNVKAGDLGGWIEKEGNLSHSGDAWVAGNAWVASNALVTGNAWVTGDALVAGNAQVTGDALVVDNAQVTGDACVTGDARVTGDALVATNSDYFCIKGAGSRNGNTTFFKCDDGEIRVNCGCFNGTIAEFAAKVHETHNGTMYELEYNAAIELVKIHFGLNSFEVK